MKKSALDILDDISGDIDKVMEKHGVKIADTHPKAARKYWIDQEGSTKGVHGLSMYVSVKR